MPLPHFEIETTLIAQGIGPVAGCDEAGRGPLAGPVAAAAVILDPTRLPVGIDDSKKLNADARADLFEIIVAQAHAIGIGLASAAEIDTLNIRRATFLAMRRAVRALPIAPAHVHVDGNALPDDLPCAAQTLVQGDALCLSIAAASIIAKVTRDRLMIRLHQQDARYGFNSHMGYGTPAHLAALAQHGPSRFHRRSFAPVRNRLAVTEV